MLDRVIAEHRDEILERWIDDIIDGYPEETAKFLRSKQDRFANPVGAGLREGLAELLDGVSSGIDPGEMTSALDRIIRVRAVQDFAPSAAVGFVFDLRRLVLEFAGDETDSPPGALDDPIERLASSAFDVYMRCREEMWRIRAKEIRNQSVGIMERVAEWRERREKKPEKLPHG
jgi:hypothetical protein